MWTLDIKSEECETFDENDDDFMMLIRSYKYLQYYSKCYCGIIQVIIY